MELLYISALSSKRLIADIFNTTGRNPGFAVQKFSRLLVQGLCYNGTDAKTLTAPPVNKSYTKKIWVALADEIEDGIKYQYMPFINISVLRHICIFLYSFFYTLKWGVKNKNDKAIICDVLCVSACMGAVLASKLSRIRTVGVVTDIYNQIITNKSRGLRSKFAKLAGFINQKYVSSFSHYVLLTDAMNQLVNSKQCPYIVMEALCDSSLTINSPQKVSKDIPRVILYAGGLEEKYGLKMLVDAFNSLGEVDAQLHIYGSGSYEEQLRLQAKNNKSIVYHGVRSNEDILDAEARATLLVNPRFSNEEFTKYSFPSKNMEYMASGTPLLTTKLPGIPTEYNEHVYYFDEESIAGYAKILKEILSLDEIQLVEKGQKAREFVLKYKNNRFQSKRILDLLER